MESWMVNGAIAAITVIGVLYINKYKTEQNEAAIAKETKSREDAVKDLYDKIEQHNRDDKKAHASQDEKLDRLSTEVTSQKVKLETVPSAKDVDDKFVSKEFFKQVQDNIYGRIDTSEKHILASMEAMGKSISSELRTITGNQMIMSDKIDNMDKRKEDK